MRQRSTGLLGLVVLIIFAAGFYSGVRFQEERSKPRASLPEASLLLDGEYLDNLLYLIDHAHSYIHVIMFVAKYDPKEPDDPANRLLYSLADAAGRGVDVKVVVDDAALRSYPDTIEYLESKGVDVRLDESSGRTTHVKMVIIDGEILVLGSHNWTESALSRNHEASIAVFNASIIGEAEQYFERIYEGGREP